MPAGHLHDEAAFSLVRLILNMALAAFNGCVLVSYIARSALEDGEKGLVLVRRYQESMKYKKKILYCTIDR